MIINNLLKTITKLIESKPLFKETIMYALANALYSGLPLLLMPFLISFLDSEDYGMIELFRNLTMIATPLIGFSTVQGVIRFYYDLSEYEFNDFCSTISLFQIFNGLVAYLLVYLTSLLINFEYWNFIFLAIVFFIFNQITELLLSITRITNKPKVFLKIRISTVLLELGLIFLFFKFGDKFSWKIKVYPQIIGAVLIGLICLYYIYFVTKVPLSFKVNLLNLGLSYSLPLILHVISGHVLNIGDRFFILHFLDKSTLGSYALASQISLIIGFLYSSFNLAWTPTYFKLMKEKQFSKIRKVRKIVYSMVTILGIGSFVFFLILKFYSQNINQYNLSTHLVIILILANTILCFYKFEGNYFFYMKKTKKISLISMFSAVLTIILNYFLVPKYGIIGAAYTTLIAFIVFYISVTILKRKDVDYQNG